MRALAFNDTSLLTCIANDYGSARLRETGRDVRRRGRRSDRHLFRGSSENIPRGTRAARGRLRVITMSGFAKDNPLRALGDLNFYVPSQVVWRGRDQPPRQMPLDHA
jgi:D-sedoheptulose 7-phosphate isomerase